MRKLLESAAPERTFLEPSDFFVFTMLLAVRRNTGAPFGAMLFSLLYRERWKPVEASMLLSLMGFSLVSVTCNHTTFKQQLQQR